MSALRVIVLSLMAIGLLSGCGVTAPDSTADLPASLQSGIRFRDVAESNVEVDGEQSFEFEFADRFGEHVDLKDFRGKKNVVLVVTRGYSQGYCPFCSAQTSRLIRNYDAFVKRNAELVVVFPGAQDRAQGFVDQLPGADETEQQDVPFAIVLDSDFTVVDKLMIRGDLAKPSTYILDRKGTLRFAYVGATPSDRPSLKAILDQLDKIEEES